MTVYDTYMAKIRKAQAAGYTSKAIANELQRERTTIMPRCVMKQAILSTDRNIYKKREAARAAHECITAIDRICKELLESGSPITIGTQQKETHNG